jgi:hypothetical protein
MDKEDCIEVLLSTLQKPQWISSNSVTDWDLQKILWESGLLLGPDQVSALLADVKRRGLIAARERREGNKVVALWGVRITDAGEEWLSQRAAMKPGAAGRIQAQQAEPAALESKEGETRPEGSQNPATAMQAGLR